MSGSVDLLHYRQMFSDVYRYIYTHIYIYIDDMVCFQILISYIHMIFLSICSTSIRGNDRHTLHGKKPRAFVP